MVWINIPKIQSYSLTDLNDFNQCPFRFFVKHHLDKKYEIEKGNSQMALGVLLDQTIKLFHQTNSYEKPVEYIPELINTAYQEIRSQVNTKPGPSFYSAVVPFLIPELINEACRVFQSYYLGVNCKIKQSLGPVGFCQKILTSMDGKQYKIWGGPDTYELGDDGLPEIVDYKSRQDIERGKSNMDMDRMPKLYTLLCSDKLLSMGYKKARFVVRFWQDPRENSFYEEFDLEQVKIYENLFLQLIGKITAVKEYSFCTRNYCVACTADNKEGYIEDLKIKFNLVSLAVLSAISGD